MAGQALLRQGVDKRREILRFIKAYIKKQGYAPTLDEIAMGVGAAKTTARYHVGVLMDEKYLAMTEGKYRSLRVVKDGRYIPVKP